MFPPCVVQQLASCEQLMNAHNVQQQNSTGCFVGLVAVNAGHSSHSCTLACAWPAWPGLALPAAAWLEWRHNSAFFFICACCAGVSLDLPLAAMNFSIAPSVRSPVCSATFSPSR